jgi:hypothetical protein
MLEEALDGGGSSQWVGAVDAEARAREVAASFAARTNSAASGAAEALRPGAAPAASEDVTELLAAHGLGEFGDDEEVAAMFADLMEAGASREDLASALRMAGEEAATAQEGWESDAEDR